jgi:hypothetical protein
VVFVGGTSYSGSTMLDMILANTPYSFSAGEVRALFEPTRTYHLDPVCGCGDKKCDIWKRVRKFGRFSLYNVLFDFFPQINTIIDSSKDPFWISEQLKSLKSKGIETRVILIWKTPAEFAFSCFKRNSLRGWTRIWKNYHRLFFSLVDRWDSVAYSDLTRQVDLKTEQLCSILNLPYDSNMITYWEKVHHTVFGNTAAKFHLYDPGSTQYKHSMDELNAIGDAGGDSGLGSKYRHRSIYYQSDFEKSLPRTVLNDAKGKSFQKYVSILTSQDVGRDSSDNPDSSDNCEVTAYLGELKFPDIMIHLHKARRRLRQNMFAIRHKKEIRALCR